MICTRLSELRERSILHTGLVGRVEEHRKLPPAQKRTGEGVDARGSKEEKKCRADDVDGNDDDDDDDDDDGRHDATSRCSRFVKRMTAETDASRGTKEEMMCCAGVGARHGR